MPVVEFHEEVKIEEIEVRKEEEEYKEVLNTPPNEPIEQSPDEEE